jgi:hypothetical protein
VTCHESVIHRGRACVYIPATLIHRCCNMKEQIELLKEIEQKLEELVKNKDFKEAQPLEVKELKGLRLVVSSIIRRMGSNGTRRTA